MYVLGQSPPTATTHLQFDVHLHYQETFNFIRGHPEHDFGKSQIIHPWTGTSHRSADHPHRVMSMLDIFDNSATAVKCKLVKQLTAIDSYISNYGHWLLDLITIARPGRSHIHHTWLTGCVSAKAGSQWVGDIHSHSWSARMNQLLH